MASQLPLYFAGMVIVSQRDVDVVDPAVLVPREEEIWRLMGGIVMFLSTIPTSFGLAL